MTRAVWWDGSWLLATGGAVARFEPDGGYKTSWTSYVDAGEEYASSPSLALVDGGVLIAYSGRPTGTNYDVVRLSAFDASLTRTAGPASLSPHFSGNVGLSSDGRAVGWSQGYASGDEGYRFSLLDASGAKIGTPDVLTQGAPLNSGVAVTSGVDSHLFAHRWSCPQVQRYALSGARLGAPVLLKPAGTPCPSSQSAVDSAVAAGKHFVAFNHWGEAGVPGWLGYALINDSTGAVQALKSLSQASTPYVYRPSTAAQAGRFAIVWKATANFAASTYGYYFVLVDAAGTQLTAPFNLGEGAKTGDPVVAASPSGFTVFWSRSGVSGITASDVSCQ